MPLLAAISTVTEFCPAVIASKAPRLPGVTSVIVRDGVQILRFGVGVGVGVGGAPGDWTSTLIGAPVL